MAATPRSSVTSCKARSNYFSTNQERMDYPQYRAVGLCWGGDGPAAHPRWLQDLLGEEVTEFLGCARYDRRRGSDDDGYGKPRRLTMRAGCGCAGWKRFESNLLT